MTSILEKYKAQLIGEKIKHVLHSDQGKGIEHLNGLGYAYYFSTVIALENGDMYHFSEEWIDLWDGSEALKEVTHTNWHIEKNIQFENQLIADILKDENDSLYILLQNNVVIYHTITYGDELFFKKHSDLFNPDKTITEFKNEKNFWSRLKTYILD